jgi:hypothetical protein
MTEAQRRRWFVGIGVGDYEKDATLKLDKALGDVERMSAWFTSETGLGHEIAVADLAKNPSWSRISTGLADFLEDRTADDVVVVY